METKLVWHTEKRKISDLIPYENNPRVMTKKQAQDLMRSIKKFNLVDIPAINTDNKIVSGHQRIVCLKTLERGSEVIDVRVPNRKLTEKEFKEYLIRANKNLGEWNFDLLKIDFDRNLLTDFGFNKVELDMTFPPEIKSEKEYKMPKEIEEKEILQYDNFVYEFSGGKDSTLAILKTLPFLKKQNKNVEALYVETGAELPELTSFVIRFCKKNELPLKILFPKEHILQYYYDKNKLPNPIFRDCQHKFINETFDSYEHKKYGRGCSKKLVHIRGGRPDQKTVRSKSKKIYKLENGLTLWSPLYDIPKEEYLQELSKIEKWSGYDAGYVRTACWFCPFQPDKQWDALQKNNPVLFQELCIIFKELKIPPIKKDRFQFKINQYFGKYW